MTSLLSLCYYEKKLILFLNWYMRISRIQLTYYIIKHQTCEIQHRIVRTDKYVQDKYTYRYRAIFRSGIINKLVSWFLKT